MQPHQRRQADDVKPDAEDLLLQPVWMLLTMIFRPHPRGFGIISAAQAMTDAHTRAINLILLHVSAAAVAAATIIVFTFAIFM